MSKKVYRAVVGVAGGLAAIAIALVTLFEPPYAVAINASIGVAEAAIAEICSFFVIDTVEKK